MYVLVAMNCSQLKFKIPPPSLKKRIKKLKRKYKQRIQTQMQQNIMVMELYDCSIWMFTLKALFKLLTLFKEVHISCTL